MMTSGLAGAPGRFFMHYFLIGRFKPRKFGYFFIDKQRYILVF
jgi:hypothetical protein